MTVFVTQEVPNLNYSAAESYGDVSFLTNRDFSPMAQSLNNSALMGQLKSGLATFNPFTDFVVLSGSPVVMAAVFLILGTRGFKTVPVLRWSNRDSIYQPIHISVL